MTNNNLIERYDELENLELTNPNGARTSKKRQSKKQEMDARLFVRTQEHSKEFRFTYQAARFEEAWLVDTLTELAEQLWIQDVLRKAKAGKEASVYLCAPGPAVSESKYVAAKVYRPRTLRNLKNDQVYRVGRTDLDAEGKRVYKEADLHAIQKRSVYGEELRHQSWITHEFATMETLFAAGADIPRPYARSGNTIVMDFVGDDLCSAPTLNEVQLDRGQALLLFERVMRNVEILLTSGFIHGDLSAYNILYWQGEIKLIDFPQVVSPHANPDAFAIFSRDVKRVCEYFAKQGVDSDPRRIARDLWAGYGYPEKESVPQSLVDADEV